MLLLLIALCAVLSFQSPPEFAAIAPDTSYSVDGISLGMSIDEVRATWGELEPHYSFEGQLWLSKPGSDPLSGHTVRFDHDKKVVFVRGKRLRRGDRLMLGPEHDYHQALAMGSSIETTVPRCSYSIELIESYRHLGGKVLLRVAHFNLEDIYDENSMAYDPDFPRHPSASSIHSISLCDEGFFKHPLGIGGEERLETYANALDVYRGVKRSYQADGLSVTLRRVEQHYLQSE